MGFDDPIITWDKTRKNSTCMLLKCGGSFSGYSALFSGSSEREGYMLYKTSPVNWRATNNSWCQDGPTKMKILKSFSFPLGEGVCPLPPLPGSFLYFQIESKTEKHWHCRGLINIKLCARKKKPSRTALLQHIKLCALFCYWTCKNHLLFGTFSPQNRKCPFNFQGRRELNKVYDNAVLTFSPPKLKARFIPCNWRSCDLVCVFSSACVRTVAYLYWQGYISKLLKHVNL